MAIRAATTSDDRLPVHGRAALSYAQRFEFAVFPVHGITPGGDCTCGHPRCEHPGKHPCTARGFKDATRETALIEDWWGRWPKANVGIATGAVSGIIALDVDPRHGGDESLDGLTAKLGKLPDTPMVLTGGGGWHYYFKHPGPEVEVPSSIGQLGPGLDVRGDSGYVVAPPSIHESGRNYAWELSGRIGEVPIAPLPHRHLELIRKPAAGEHVARPVSAWVEFIRGPIGEGARNDSLARLAGHLSRIRVLDPAIAAELVHAVNEAKCRPPLARGEVEAIVQSIAAREAARLREGRK